MTLWKWAAVLLFGSVATAAPAPPEFTAAGVARGTVPAKMVVPGTFLTIYGTNLAPWRCSEADRASDSRVKQCGSQVFIGDIPAELLYVSQDQINFKVPQDSPRGGTVDIRVVSNGQSSLPVSMKAGFEQTAVSLDGPAYTDMPVWLKVELPYEFGTVTYPYILGPGGIGCNMVEVRRNGQMLTLLPGSNWARFHPFGPGNICSSDSPPNEKADRLPLHLLYRFDAPGVYEVRYSLNSSPVGFYVSRAEVRAHSEWTPIEVRAAKSDQRSDWLRSLRNQAPSDPTDLLTDILPSLLGVPDDASFDILAGYLYHPNISVQGYALEGLSYWPEEFTLRKIQALVQTRGASEAVTRYIERQRAIAIKKAQ